VAAIGSGGSVIRQSSTALDPRRAWPFSKPKPVQDVVFVNISRSKDAKILNRLRKLPAAPF
jgi:hypothetical protein